jgi:hypothetical protein
MSRRFFYNLLIVLPLLAATSFGFSLFQTDGAFLSGGRFSNLSFGDPFSIASAQAQVGCLKADPSSVVGSTNGAIYYNSCSGKFRAYANGAWEDLGASWWSKGGASGSEYLYPTNLNHTLALGYPGYPAPAGVYPPLLSTSQNLIYGVIISPSSVSGPVEGAAPVDASPNLVNLETASWDSVLNEYDYNSQFVVTSSGQAQAKDFCILNADDSCSTLAGASYWLQNIDERLVDNVTTSYPRLIPSDDTWEVHVGKDGRLVSPKICVPNGYDENCISDFSQIKAASDYWGYEDTNDKASPLRNNNVAGTNQGGDIQVTRDLMALKNITALGTIKVDISSLPITSESLDIVDVVKARDVDLLVAVWSKKYVMVSTDKGLSWNFKQLPDAVIGYTNFIGWASPDGNWIVSTQSSKTFYAKLIDNFSSWSYISVTSVAAAKVFGNNDYAFLPKTNIGNTINRLSKEGILQSITLNNSGLNGIRHGWVSDTNDELILVGTYGLSKCTRATNTSYNCVFKSPSHWPDYILTTANNSLMVAVSNLGGCYFYSTDRFATFKTGLAPSIYATNDIRPFLTPVASGGNYYLTTGSSYHIYVNRLSSVAVDTVSIGDLTSYRDYNWTSSGGYLWQAAFGSDSYSSTSNSTSEFLSLVGNDGQTARHVTGYDRINLEEWNTNQLSTTGLFGVWGNDSRFIVVGQTGALAWVPITGVVGAKTLGTWTLGVISSSLSSSVDYKAVSGSSNTVVAVGKSTTVALSTDGGTNWSGIGNTFNTINYGVWMKDASNFWAAGNAGITKFTYSGSSWTASAAQNVAGNYRAIHGFNNTIIAVGDNGKIVYSTNAGSTWTYFTGATPTTRDFYGVWVTSATNAVVVGSSGEVAEIVIPSVYNSKKSTIATEVPSWWVDALAVGGKDSLLRAVGKNGEIMQSRNSGVTWEAFKKFIITPQLNGVYTVGEITLAVGNGNSVLIIYDIQSIGGNIIANKDIKAGENIWGGSEGGSPSDNSEAGNGLIQFTSGGSTSSCPKGEFMVGVFTNGVGKVTGLYCQKL